MTKQTGDEVRHTLCNNIYTEHDLYFASGLSEDEIKTSCKYLDGVAFHLFKRACINGNHKVIECLLGKGFDPNVPMQHDSMNSAISIAYRQGHSGVARLLLEKGAKISDENWKEIKIAIILLKNATVVNGAVLNECKVSDFNNAIFTDPTWNKIKKCLTVDIIANNTTITGTEVECSGEEYSDHQHNDEFDIL